MNQLAINFNPRTLARRTDPATSKQAAERVHEFAGGQHAVILAVLRDHGPCTAHEIAEHCRLEPHAIGRRLGELERAGQAQVVILGYCMELTRKTPSGRRARVWEAQRKCT